MCGLSTHHGSNSGSGVFSQSFRNKTAPTVRVLLFCYCCAWQGVGGGFTCGCLDYDLEQGDDYLTVMDGMDYVGELLEGYKENTKREVVDIICKAHVADGDHLQVGTRDRFLAAS